MSELAFNINGERFDLPATAALWRVRRLRDVPRGGPEVVFSRGGLPLVLPIDIDMDAFRQGVEEAPGRYRLDPIDERHHPVEGVPAAYICVAKTERPGASAAVSEITSRPGDARDQLLREVVRANTEMVTTIAEKFASVMESAAVLLRAADGAGLPARTPPPAVPAEDEDDDDQGDGEEPSRSELSDFLGQLMPLIQATIAQKLGGAGKPPAKGKEAPRDAAPRNAGHVSPAAVSHFDAVLATLARREAELTETAAEELSPAARAAWLGQLAQLSIPEAAAEIRRTMAAGAPAEAGGAEGGAPTDEAAWTEEDGEPSEAAPAAGPAELAHFAAIQARLTAKERALAQGLATKLPPPEVQRWMAELGKLSVDEAVALIRKTVAGQNGGAS